LRDLAFEILDSEVLKFELYALCALRFLGLRFNNPEFLHSVSEGVSTDI
jgi:hypothetical protein